MEQLGFSTQITSIEKELSRLEHKITQTSGMYFSYNEAAELLGRKPTVVSQYVKAGLINFIQQGPRKLISIEDFYILKCCMYLTKTYGMSYTACKLVCGMLKSSKLQPENYFNYLKKIEQKQNITQEEVYKHVNSYENRGLFQKQKNQKSKQSL